MRGIARVMKRSRNSYIRAPRSVTVQPTGMPARSPKLAIAFLALVTTAFWPVIRPSSSTAASSCLGFFPASPMPTLSTTFTSRGTSCGLVRPNSFWQLGAHRLLVERLQPRHALGGLGRVIQRAGAALLLALALAAGRRPRPSRLPALRLRRLRRLFLRVSAIVTGSSGSAGPTSRRCRSTVPSASMRRRTRVGAPPFGSSSITFEWWIGASRSMIPASAVGVWRWWRLMMLTPCTVTRPVLG